MTISTARRRLGLAITASSFAIAEFILSLAGYRISPLDLLPQPAHDDIRAVYLSGTRFTRFDPDLLWRLDDALDARIDKEGFCGTPPGPHREPEAKLLVFLGDSSSCGPPAAHWTVQLQTLLDLNAGEGPRHQVVDAGVWGYSSFQGVRRFEQILSYRPEFVFFAFGVGDAQEARLSDGAYAARLRSLNWLSLSRVAAVAGRSFGLLQIPAAVATNAVRRVSHEDYRRHVREFVAHARRAHVIPVLVVPDDADEAVAPYAAILREIVEVDGVLGLDPARRGLQPGMQEASDRAVRTAASAIELLRTLGVVATDRVFEAVVEPGRLEDHRAELGRGFWGRETWKDGQTGRWTGETASVSLERGANEGGLALEATFLHPENQTRLRIEVNGVTLGVLESPNGRVHRTLNVRSLLGRHLAVQLIAERPFVPGKGDARKLGVFLHRLALVPNPEEADLLLAGSPSVAPELGSGWWPPEQWGDGQQGRWTQETATLRIARRPSDSRLILDLSGGHPEGHASVRVDINGVPVKRLEVHNTAATYSIDLHGVSGSSLDVRLVAERPFVPNLVKRESRDERRLGIFVRAVRLAAG